MSGDIEQMYNSLSQSRILDAQVIDRIVERSKMTRKQIRKILPKEKWLSAEECVELGLADRIITSVSELVAD